MTHFEAYHWEDHVPRKGGWKINLAAGFLALGLIYAALPNASDAPPATAAVLTHEVHDLEVKVSSEPPPIVQPVKSWWAYCPTAATDYADS